MCVCKRSAISLPRICCVISSSVVVFPLFGSSPPPSLCLPLSLSLCAVCVSVPLPPLFPVPCYSISEIYLSRIISAALLCVASPSHLCALPLAPSPPLPLFPSLILICILAIQLNRLWLCNELTSHFFFFFFFFFCVYASVHARKSCSQSPCLSITAILDYVHTKPANFENAVHV